MATLTPPKTLNFFELLSESKRIINSHSRHFLALSVLFLLPLSFSFIIFPTFSTISPSNSITSKLYLQYTSLNHHQSHKDLTFPLLYALFLYSLSLSAVATITHSTYHGFHGRPVKLFSAIRSIFSSFIPLVCTTVISQFVILSIFILFAVFLGFVIKGAEYLGFDIDSSSSSSSIYFIGLVRVGLLALGLVVIYLQVNWALSCVIVIVESKWGLEPLWRSAKLVRGMRSVSLSVLLFYGFFIGISIWGNSTAVASFSGNGWKSWAFVLQTVVGSATLTIFMLHYAASSTVLYMYCKALHGVLDFEIAEEFAREYVSLPFDDEKLPRVVSVVLA